MDRQGDVTRSGSLFPRLYGRPGEEDGANRLASGRLGGALSRLSSKCLAAVPQRMRSGYAPVVDGESIPLVSLDAEGKGGGQGFERGADTTRSGSLLPTIHSMDRRGEGQAGAEAGHHRRPGPVTAGVGSRHGRHNVKAIPKFRNGYLRLADLEAISIEQTGNGAGDDGRGGAPTPTVKHLLAVVQARASSAAAASRANATGTWLQRSGSGTPHASYFCRVLEQELTRVQRFAESFAEELWVRLGGVFEALEELSAEGKRTKAIKRDRLETASGQCDLIGDDIILLDEFLRQNVVAGAFITQKHDSKVLPGSLRSPNAPSQISPAYIQAVEAFLASSISYDPILINLSDAYSQLKALANLAFSDGTVWNAPEVFERKTVKYWVHPANVLRVKCMLIKHLPILIYGAGSGVGSARKRLAGLKEQKQKAGTLISSVYFDNEQLQTYHDRIVREHGASLTRIRWYNKRVLTDDMETFIERKIHGDSWTGIKSVKERSPMPAPEVPDFINGRHVKAMDVEGSKGERLLDIQQKVFGERREEPSMRTEYSRVAFQESSNNEVRISLDSHVRMIREKGVPRGPTGWHRDVVVNEPQPGVDVVNFPYAILETKVAAEDTPDWVQEILDTGMLVEVPKFSKFLHGSALLNGDSVRSSPFWFVPDDHGRYTPATISEMADPHDNFDKNASKNNAVAALSEVLVVPPPPQDPAPDESKGAGKGKGKGAKASTRAAALVRTRIEPKTFFANERTFLSWLTIAVLVMFMGLTLLDGASIAGGSVGVSGAKACGEDSTCRVQQMSGVIISPVALVLLVYALYQYRKRSIQILRRETVRFDDQRGPIMITALLLVVLVTAYAISIRTNL